MAHIVQPSQIESELEQIWDSFQGTNKMRACLFNLIIYAKKSQRINYLTQIAQKVIEKFPSRIIFVTFDDKAGKNTLKTAVSVMTADEGESEIACDLIEIEVSQDLHNRVPFLILPHILPDLPIYLVYGDDPAVKNPVSEKLEKFSNRIIFDSESTSDLPSFARAVLAHHDKSHADVADLNWARTEGWRELFSGVFKSEDDLNMLKKAEKITIAYNCEESDYLCHTNIQSIYLQAWIAARLEWSLKEIKKGSQSLSLIYNGSSHDIQVTLKPAKMENVSAGRILSIKVETDQNCHYSFERSQRCSHHVVISKSDTYACALPSQYVLDRDVSGQSLVKEICHKGTSGHYLEMIQSLSEIKNERLCS